MAVPRKNYIFSTFLLSCVSLTLLGVGIATEQWIRGSGDSYSINYGLFRGTFVQSVIGTTFSTVYQTCIYENNICAYSCRPTAELRKRELLSYYSGKPLQKGCMAEISEMEDPEQVDVKWFNVGVYVCTLIFLGLTILFSLMCGLFGLYNTIKTPIEPMWGVFGLYIWNGCAAGCSLIALMLWGIHYETNLKEGLGFTVVMFHENVDSSIIGYSYWLVFGSVICHLIAEGLLIGRWWLIEKEPPPPTIQIEKTDDTIFLY